MQHYTSEQVIFLQEIRKSILMKKQNSPAYLSKDEFAAWKGNHDGCYLHKGHLSIWNDIIIPEGSKEIVVEKRSSRENEKPYLVFDNAVCFRNYCRNAHLLGVEVYTLFENRFSNTIKSIAKTYSALLSSYDELQNEVEKSIGLNFSLDDIDISDEQLYGTLYSYMKKTVIQKAYTVFLRQGIFVDLDISDFEKLLLNDDTEFIESVTCTNINEKEIDLKALFDKIAGLIEELTADKTSKYDVKDNLLRQVINSEIATGEFVLRHYALLNNRKSVWRPIAFSFQVQYSHDHGEMYLKNPSYVQKCGGITIGEMISSQIESYSGSNKKALSNMHSLLRRAKDEGVFQKPLSECTESTEQTGKALSKELRTEEAKSALARALLITALEKEQMTSFYEIKGDEHYE